MGAARHPGAGSGSGLRARRWRALGRCLRWLRPPRVLRPTRAGWIFFGLTLAVGFAALNTGNNLLYLVLSLMLAFLVLSGVLSESALRGVSVRRRLPSEIVVDRPASVALVISNGQLRVPSFAVVVEDRVREHGAEGRAAGRAFVLRVSPRSSETAIYRFQARRRGPLVFTSFRISTRFPFGLFVKSLVVEARARALALPALDRPPAAPARSARRTRGESGPAGLGPGSEVAGLRDFAQGDSARRIEWRASLRSGALVVRDTEREDDTEVEVRLRTRNQAAGEAFEEAVCRAAAAVDRACAAGGRVTLRTDDEWLRAGMGARHRLRLLAFLARVEPRRPRTGADA